jgi:hypothetical protein
MLVCYLSVDYAGLVPKLQPSSMVERAPSVDRRDWLAGASGTPTPQGLPKLVEIGRKTRKNPKIDENRGFPVSGPDLGSKIPPQICRFSVFSGWAGFAHAWPQSNGEKSFSCALINPTKIASRAPNPGGR